MPQTFVDPLTFGAIGVSVVEGILSPGLVEVYAALRAELGECLTER